MRKMWKSSHYFKRVQCENVYYWHLCKNYHTRPNLTLLSHKYTKDENTCRAFTDFVGGSSKSHSCTEIIDFENHKEAFKERTISEIVRSFAILKLCGISGFTKNCVKIAEVCKMILGKSLYENLMKRTFYGQFVAGDREAEIAKTIATLHKNNILCMIACPTEDEVTHNFKREEKYNRCLEKTVDCIRLSGKYQPEFAMTQIKLSGLLPTAVLIKLNSLKEDEIHRSIQFISEIFQGGSIQVQDNFACNLNASEFHQLQEGIRRLRQICEAGEKLNVAILVDAEYTSINAGITILTMAMMKAFNEKRAIVWNTYQCYLKSAYDNIHHDASLAKRLGICFGAKIVRGAYLTQERELAQLNGYEDPVNNSYEDTSAMYHRVTSCMIDYIKTYKEKCQIVVATHNEASIRCTINRMREASLKHNDHSITFAQLFGMCDQISYSLAQHGYITYKSMPFGSVDDVLPYLHRRAMENVDVLYGSRKEVELLQKEIKYRIKRLFL